MKELKIGIMADLHGDMMPDARDRLETFIRTMKEKQVDCIIQLGDLCQIGAGGNFYGGLFDTFQGPRYHVLGNHDADDCDKSEAVSILGMPGNYYSFRIGDYKGIVLDTNYHYDEESGTYADFDRHNVTTGRSLPHVPPEELAWLKKELEEEECRILIFSHANLAGPGTSGIGNQEVLWKVIAEANQVAGYRKVVACFHGHDHFDSTHIQRGVYSLGIPSISNQWLGDHNYNTDLAPELIEKYPDLEHVILYKDPLYTVITCTEDGIKIEGKKTEYLGGTPEKYGRPLPFFDDYMSSELKEKVLPY